MNKQDMLNELRVIKCDLKKNYQALMGMIKKLEKEGGRDENN